MQILSEQAIDELLRCTNPVFEDLYPSGGKDEYAFRGTSFTAKFHDRLYLVTAGHVVSDQSAQNLRVFDPVTAHSLPFKKFHPRKSSEDRDDLAVFEIETTMLGTEELARLSPILLDQQDGRQLKSLPRDSLFAVKGYPIERGQVNVEAAKLNNRSYEIDGRSGGRLSAGLHNVVYSPDIPIRDLGGMSGAPWIVAGSEATEWVSLVAGVHISAAQSGAEISGIFVTAEAL